MSTHYLLGLTFFLLAGVLVHVLLRLFAPWAPKHQPVFWAITLGSLVAASMFLTPYLPAKVLEMFYALGAGACISEFLRQKLQGRLAQLDALRQQVNAEAAKPSRSAGRKGKSSKPKE